MKFSNISRSMFGALLASFFLTTSSITQAFDERLKRDAFGNAAAGGVTDDANRDLRNLLVDPVTGELLTKSGPVSGGATEDKQDELNALMIIIDAVLDQMKLDTAKLTSDPATAALQTTLNTLITALDAVMDAIKLDTANISDIVSNTSGNATQTTLALMNAKFVTGTDIGDVTINNASGADAVNIQDGGNEITVEGSDVDNTAAGTDGHMMGGVVSGGNFKRLFLNTDGTIKLGASSEAIGKMSANSGVDIGDVDILTQTLSIGAPVQGNKAIIVGVGPTEILAADLGRSFALVCNADNTLVAVGKTGLTINSVLATDGKVLGISGTADADDGKGGCLNFETTPAIFGKGTDSGSKVTVIWGTK